MVGVFENIACGCYRNVFIGDGVRFEPIGDLLVFVTESVRKKEEIRGLLQGGPGFF